MCVHKCGDMVEVRDSLQVNRLLTLQVLATELRTSVLVASTLASVPTCPKPPIRLKEEIIYCAWWFHKLQFIVPGSIASVHMMKKVFTAAKAWDGRADGQMVLMWQMGSRQ